VINQGSRRCWGDGIYQPAHSIMQCLDIIIASLYNGCLLDYPRRGLYARKFDPRPPSHSHQSPHNDLATAYRSHSIYFKIAPCTSFELLVPLQHALRRIQATPVLDAMDGSSTLKNIHVPREQTAEGNDNASTDRTRISEARFD
jgi:hypothetical protein